MEKEFGCYDVQIVSHMGGRTLLNVEAVKFQGCTLQLHCVGYPRADEEARA